MSTRPVLLCLVLLCGAVLGGPYRKPPFNGSIFGKRAAAMGQPSTPGRLQSQPNADQSLVDPSLGRDWIVMSSADLQGGNHRGTGTDAYLQHLHSVLSEAGNSDDVSSNGGSTSDLKTMVCRAALDTCGPWIQQ